MSRRARALRLLSAREVVVQRRDNRWEARVQRRVTGYVVIIEAAYRSRSRRIARLRAERRASRLDMEDA